MTDVGWKLIFVHFYVCIFNVRWFGHNLCVILCKLRCFFKQIVRKENEKPINLPINPRNPFIGDLRYFFSTDKKKPWCHMHRQLRRCRQRRLIQLYTSLEGTNKNWSCQYELCWWLSLPCWCHSRAAGCSSQTPASSAIAHSSFMVAPTAAMASPTPRPPWDVPSIVIAIV
jgi:hypothetical protein